MRRHPGDWLHGKIQKWHQDTNIALLLSAIFVWFLIGLSIGLLIEPWIVRKNIIHLTWALVMVLCIAVLIYFWVRWFVRRRVSTADRMAKGRDAEKTTGQRIEYSISHPECAVAHNVMEIAEHGDIDHLVMTPEKIWVIETKSGKVPGKEFPKVLSKIAANVRAVREKFPGENVLGCLVIANEADYDRIKKKKYTHGSETIYCEGPKSLRKKLHGETGGVKPSERAKQIWALGKVDE